MLRTRHTNTRLLRHAGFTIVELAVVVTVLGILLPIISSFFVTMYRDAFTLDSKSRTTSETAQALWYVNDSVRLSSSFLTSVPTVYSDPYGANNLGTAGANAWTYKGSGDTNRVLITKDYATSSNLLNTSRQPVYTNTPSFNCTTQMYYQPQLTYISIYFVRASTLYKRLLTDTTTPLCAGNSQQQRQSCPPEIAPGARNALCQANDEVLATNVSGFSVAYFQLSQAGEGSEIDPGYDSTDPDILAPADYITLSVTSTLTDKTPITITQRITKINQ